MKMTNEYIAVVMSNYVHYAGPQSYLMREITEDEDRFFKSEYADHEGADISAMKTEEGYTIIYLNGRQLIRNPMNFSEHEFLCQLIQSEGE